MRERLIWISAGLLGLLLAAALAGATSRVTRPDVGLAGEPVSAGQALAPPPATTVTVAVPARVKARPAKRAQKHVKAARKAPARPAPAAPAKRVPAPATTAAAKKPARAASRRKRASTTATTTTAKKRTPAVVGKVKTPKIVPPVLPTPTVTVETKGGDEAGKGKGKDGGGDRSGGKGNGKDGGDGGGGDD
ncbi:MAG: hypothetical protein QOD69_555 [Solirubrobacteraceae bacterium]|nr:hypothetical protein [Solirubrobacteraceae bacterium]